MKIDITYKDKKLVAPTLLLGIGGETTKGEIILIPANLKGDLSQVLVLRASHFYKDRQVPYFVERGSLTNPAYWAPFDGPITLQNN